MNSLTPAGTRPAGVINHCRLPLWTQLPHHHCFAAGAGQDRGEIAALELRNEQLQLELERLTSPEHLEEVARRQLGLVKPGETIFYIAEPADDDGP